MPMKSLRNLRPARWLTALAALVLLDMLPARADEQAAPAAGRLLGRGVNLGNALEAPREGAWGWVLKEDDFARIRQAGFQSVRIPIRWSAHAQETAPYTIDATFFQRVDWAIEQALKRELTVVINVHHYEELFEQPAEHKPRFLAIWQQIASRYQAHLDRVVFELLNEPHGNLTAALWNELLHEGLDVVRQTNPDRFVIVGPAGWNNPSQLPQLELPANDRRLVVTFHYYSPFQFTHQGANWVSGSDRWLGTPWRGTEAERQAVANDLERAAAWAREHDRPLYLGEFGAYSRADLASRARWTTFVRQTAEQHKMAWAYWEFAAGFGVFDRQRAEWREELRVALIPE
jgi:endoglucanase